MFDPLEETADDWLHACPESCVAQYTALRTQMVHDYYVCSLEQKYEIAHQTATAFERVCEMALLLKPLRGPPALFRWSSVINAKKSTVLFSESEALPPAVVLDMNDSHAHMATTVLWFELLMLRTCEALALMDLKRWREAHAVWTYNHMHILDLLWPEAKRFARGCVLNVPAARTPHLIPELYSETHAALALFCSYFFVPAEPISVSVGTSVLAPADEASVCAVFSELASLAPLYRGLLRLSSGSVAARFASLPRSRQAACPDLAEIVGLQLPFALQVPFKTHALAISHDAPRGLPQNRVVRFLLTMVLDDMLDNSVQSAIAKIEAACSRIVQRFVEQHGLARWAVYEGSNLWPTDLLQSAAFLDGTQQIGGEVAEILEAKMLALVDSVLETTYCPEMRDVYLPHMLLFLFTARSLIPHSLTLENTFNYLCAYAAQCTVALEFPLHLEESVLPHISLQM